MSYVFLMAKEFDSWSKKRYFRPIFFWKKFIAPKDSSLNFRESLLSYFWAILLISAVIIILEDVGSLPPARTVTVKKLTNI